MYAPKFLHSRDDFNEHIIPREKHYLISLAQIFSTITLDFTSNPNLMLDFTSDTKEKPAVGLLINQDCSCWITNLGPDGFAEVYRFEGSIHRQLSYNQVAYVRHGDLVAFNGRLFRMLFGFSTVKLNAIQADVVRTQNLQ